MLKYYCECCWGSIKRIVVFPTKFCNKLMCAKINLKLKTKDANPQGKIILVKLDYSFTLQLLQAIDIKFNSHFDRYYLWTKVLKAISWLVADNYSSYTITTIKQSRQRAVVIQLVLCEDALRVKRIVVVCRMNNYCCLSRKSIPSVLWDLAFHAILVFYADFMTSYLQWILCNWFLFWSAVVVK